MEPKTSEKICPVCKTHNPGDARFCGKDGVSLESVAPTPVTTTKRTVLPDLAGGLGIIIAAILGVVGLGQLVLSTTGAGSVAVAGDTEMLVYGLWNLVVATAYVLIACGLFARRKRAYDWGIGTSVINVIFPLLMSGEAGAAVLILTVPNALMAVLVYASKSEFAAATPGVVDEGQRRSVDR